MNRAEQLRAARTVDVVVVGAGHSGLAMSHVLSEHGVDHVVLERGRVANTWRTERWDSLRLLTPNWMTRLPGHAYAGDDPDGYMRVDELVDFITDYATRATAPILTHTRVLGITPARGGYRVVTDQGDFQCRALVLATGAFNTPCVPRFAESLPAQVQQLTALSYRNPSQLAFDRVLVVGASATGVQFAHEIARSGRPVTLAVGEHVRMPRVYRGRDIQWWMHTSGLLDQRLDEMDDPARARRVPSPQLVGADDRSTLDLNALQASGVELVGRFAGVRHGTAQFSGSLRNVCALADLKMNRLLGVIDAWIEESGSNQDNGAPERFAPTSISTPPRLSLDLDTIGTVIWATGFRPDYSWLHVPALDERGHLRHNGGVVDAPGLYALGLPFLRRRNSTFIHGAEQDVREIGGHLAEYLGADRAGARWGSGADERRAGSRVRA